MKHASIGPKLILEGLGSSDDCYHAGTDKHFISTFWVTGLSQVSTVLAVALAYPVNS